MNERDFLLDHGRKVAKELFESFCSTPVNEQEVANAIQTGSPNIKPFDGEPETNSLNAAKIEAIFNLEHL